MANLIDQGAYFLRKEP